MTSAVNRWVGVGRSADKESYTAGSSAATNALRGRDASLMIVFASDDYDLEELLRGINDVSGDRPLIGCSTAGEIATDGPDDSSVVVTALGGEGFSVTTAAARGASKDLRLSGSSVARSLEIDPLEQPHQVLMLLTDGLAGDQQEIMRGIYEVTGASVPLVGGCAGDDLDMKQTHQFHGREVMTDAVVAAGLGSAAPLGIGVHHGWRAVGEPMIVTKSEGNKVYSLDNRPALDVYLERLEAPPEVHEDPAAFTRFAMTHPLGLRRRSDEPQVRFIGEADLEERALICIAEVPRSGMVWLMEGDADSVLEATDAACRDALVGIDRPLGFVAFDCIARRGVLGDEGIKSEVKRIAAHADGAPVAGFYTYGEIARTKGITGFHNQTLVVLAIG
ncbi:MAG: hypothetical protein QOG16_1215 [Actinomycetota bacterium]|nr:hypothetical protein [Actinomycetota bacterium]